MNKAQRIVLILYCLLLVYCCVWIPWRFGQPDDYLRVGYGWLWAGPVEADPLLAAPELPLIFLRIAAATALSAAAFLLAGLWKSATRN
jgi:hypothetical protein